MDASDKSTTPELDDARALAAFQSGAERAAAKYLAGLLTEPMTIRELASEWFGVNRNTMAAMLKHIDGIERCGRFYRLPVAKMPPAYHAARGMFSRE